MRSRPAASPDSERPFRVWGKGRWAPLLTSVVLLVAAPLWCQPSQPLVAANPLTDADQILRFADALFNTGDYFRAITEYKRFLFFYSRDPRAGQVQLQIGRSYLRGQQWDEARQTFEVIARQSPDANIRSEAAFLIGETSYAQGRYRQAIEDFRRAAAQYPQSAAGEKARYRLGWSYLQARQWSEAAKAFAAVQATSPLYPSAHALVDATHEAEELPRKSPVLAGLMSALLPGAGHFYTGRWRDGTVAFLLNGGFLTAGLEAVAAGNDAAAGLLFFFEAAWYSGSVYGAVNAAHKYNRDTEDRWLQGLELQHNPALHSLSRAPHTLVLVRIPF